MRGLLRTRTVDPTRGPLLSSFLIFTIPIAISSLIQVLFNAADLAVLGAFGSTLSVAAVGATGPIVSLLVHSIVGLASGTNILLARALGAGDRARSQRIVGTSVVMSVAVGTLFAVIGILCAPAFLRLTACDPLCSDDARLYMSIYFAAVPAVLVYNFGASILRVSGDSSRPLYYMLASGALNVILNLILCVLLPQKVAAVAIATLVSQVLGAVLVLRRLSRMEGPCRLDIRHISFHMRELGNILRAGLPGAFNTALYSISNLQIQAAINSFGPASTAGSAAAGQLEGVASSITSSVHAAALAFVGQNLGANNRERVKQSLRVALLIGTLAGLVLGVGGYLIGRPLLDLFVPNDELAEQTIAFGMVRLAHILAIYFIAGANGVLNSATQAFGYPTLPMLNSIVTVLLFRFFWMGLVYPRLPFGADAVVNSVNLYACYPWSWSLSLLVNIGIFTVVYGRYRRGKLRAV